MPLFLDIDGVLRREHAPLYHFEADLRDNFETVMRAFPKVDIVISSTWRLGFMLPEIRKHFSPDMRARVIAVTPVIRGSDTHTRYHEVLRFLAQRSLTGPWVALDDDRWHYPELDNVVIVESEKGLDSSAIEIFRAVMERSFKDSAS